MDKQGQCAMFAVLYDLHRRAAGFHTGLTLAVDLDRAAVSICRCEPSGSVTPVWDWQGATPAPFFPALARTIAPDYPDQTALSDALYAAAPGWSRALRSHIRSPQSGMILPSVLDGTPAIPVETLANLFEAQWAEPIGQALDAACDYLNAQKDPTVRILPFGALARLFIAEYQIRQRFFPGPAALFPVLPGLAACAPGEDPDQYVREGQAIWEELAAKARSLEAAVMLQVLRRSDDGPVSELLTLAEQNTPYDRLGQVQYSAPVFVDIREPLVIYYGSKMHRVTIPYGTLGKGRNAVRTEVGLGIQDDCPTLMLRLPEGECAAVPLELT